jgi:hypothetical protein
LPCIEFEVPRGNAKIDEDPFDWGKNVC